MRCVHVNCRAALAWSYILDCIVVAIAIFHAGVFPLYKKTSAVRYYKHKLQVRVCLLHSLLLNHLLHTLFLSAVLLSLG
jgi:hypothetical protein